MSKGIAIRRRCRHCLLHGVTDCLFLPCDRAYYVCQTHSAVWLHGLNLYTTQAGCIDRLISLLGTALIYWRRLFHRASLHAPCTTSVVLWFLRKWGRAFWFLIFCDKLMIVSINLLEQHYVVDPIAGVPVVPLAIAIVDWQAIKLAIDIALRPSWKLE